MDLIESQPLDTPPPEIEDGSLADHEAQYGTGQALAPVAEPVEEPAAPVEKPRHRASSQKASVEDVAQINALTKELRDQEAALLKVKPDAISGSPRVTTLQRQIRAIKAELAELEPPKPAPVTPPAAVAQPARPTAAPSAFTEKELTLGEYSAQHADAADPYSAHQRYLAAYDRRKEAFEAQQVAQREQQTQAQTVAQQAEQAEYQQTVATYQARVAAFQQTHPDFDAVLNAVKDATIPPLAQKAILTHDKGPELVYTLAQSPSLAAELHVLTEGKPLSDSLVASVQRWLTARVQAVPTGSAAPLPRNPAPRPPNPVRTGPMSTGDELPGDESSLADHEKAFGPRPRR